MRFSKKQIERFHIAASTLTYGKICLMIGMSLIWLTAGLAIPKETRALDQYGIVAKGLVVDKRLKSGRRGKRSPHIYYEYSYEDNNTKPLKRNAPIVVLVERDNQRVSRDIFDAIDIGDEVEVTYLVKRHSNQSRITRPIISNMFWYCFSGFAILVLSFTVFLSAVKGGHILKRAHG